MEQRPALTVNLLLNIQRRWGDTTKSEHLVAEFAHTVWQKAWPGQRRPMVYYDPRSVELDEPGKAGATTRAVLHAKVAVVDDEALFLTSANLTEAAGERNIEMGILTAGPEHGADRRQLLPTPDRQRTPAAATRICLNLSHSTFKPRQTTLASACSA